MQNVKGLLKESIKSCLIVFLQTPAMHLIGSRETLRDRT